MAASQAKSKSELYDKLDPDGDLIRILTILPSQKPDDQIKVELETVCLAEDPVYEALSYVWGTINAESTISVNGIPFKVRENLFEILYELRRSTAPRRLWIDAISINQEDDAERTAQVRCMRQIYSQASCVLVWLGQSDEGIDDTLQMLQVSLAEGQDFPQSHRIRSKMEPALGRLFSRPWWKRMWTFQELVLGGNDVLVACGPRWFPWSVFESIIQDLAKQVSSANLRWLNGLTTSNRFSLVMISSIRRRRLQSSAEKLADLFNATLKHTATDPRDHVFALAGLVDDTQYSYVEPNYQISKSTVFQRAMIGLLTESESLEPLRMAVNHKCPDIPTWCIDFCHGAYIILTSTRRRNELTWVYDKALFSVESHNPSRYELVVEGCQIGHITDIIEISFKFGYDAPFESRDNELSVPSTVEKIQQLHSFIEGVKGFASVATNALETRLGKETAARRLAQGDLWKIMAGSWSSEYVARLTRVSNVTAPEMYQAMQTMVSGWPTKLPTGNLPWHELVKSCPAQLKDSMWDVLMAACRESDPCQTGSTNSFTTDTGFLGTAYAKIREGDMVYFLFHCSQPVVLRQKGACYEFITSVYAEDVMEEELIKSLEPQQLRLI